MMKKIWPLLLLTVLFMDGASAAPKKTKRLINAGPWRFEVKLNYVNVPFVINFKWKKGRLLGVLQNGKEKIPLNDIAYAKKEIFIPIQSYELKMVLKVNDRKKVIGELIRLNKNPVVSMPVVGTHGIKHRYPGDKIRSKIKLNGKWSITMSDDKGAKSKGVLVFHQNGNFIDGTILTPTGDYRYFDGYISDTMFEAASFDGVYNYVLRGKLDKSGELEAKLLSNTTTLIKGVQDAHAALPDPYTQTQVGPLRFVFPDLSGRMITLESPQFKDKPVIIQIFGSWCPNCLDELHFLVPWYKENHARGIEVMALAFERSLSEEDAKRQLLKTRAKYQVPYPILIAGVVAEHKPMDRIPALKNFISFPTTIFLNKKHEVVKVHAGFSGPSTGEFYETFKKEFAQTVDELLK